VKTTPEMLDVFLRGSRNYVQGTQIIARLADRLPAGDWYLEQATFQHLTTRTLTLSRDVEAAAGQAAGSVTFRSVNGDSVSLFAVETEIDAPQRDTKMPIAVLRTDQSDTDVAVWHYSGVSGFEDLMNVIVQAIKAENSLRWPDAEDIWFTGLRRLDLQIRSDFENEGTIGVSLYRKLGVSGQIQTIWQIRLPGCNPAGMVTFALKLG
jgi:hypothetical protein